MAHNAVTQWNPAASRLLLAVALDPRVIGSRIKAARKKKGWTQFEFANEANVSISSVSRWETGKLPPVRELLRIGELLGVEPDYLVEPEISDDEVKVRLGRMEAQLEELAGLVRELAGRDPRQP